MSLLAATRITAVATAVLALFAIVTAVFAMLAFLKQSKEVTLLQEQAKRDVTERTRAQAAKVFAAVLQEMGDNDIRIHNTSEQPIYDPVASWEDGPEIVRLPVLMPGETHQLFADPPAPGTPLRLDFRDAAGLQWGTTSQGRLTGPL